MINIYETYSFSDDIIALWQEAFGDSRGDVLFFTDNCKNKSCICLDDENGLCSMLFLVDCIVGNHQFKYAYAVCTLKSSRRKGFMSTLLDYCIKKYDRILLIPADNDLVDYYLSRGFTHKLDIENIIFNESEEIKEYLFEGCSLEEPFALSTVGV